MRIEEKAFPKKYNYIKQISYDNVVYINTNYKAENSEILIRFKKLN